jgi:hypothetical protein
MNEHEILQSFWHSSDGTWTPLKTIAVAGVEQGVNFRAANCTAGLMSLSTLMAWRPTILFPCRGHNRRRQQGSR